METLHDRGAARPMTLARRQFSLRAVPVQVQTAAQVKQDAAITERLKSIIATHGQMAEKYRDLILYVRQHKVDEAIVRIRMLALGFKRSRISEVIKVAYSPANIFNPFAAKQIGFGRALEFARKDGKKVVATEAASLVGVTPSDARATLAGRAEATRRPYGVQMKGWAKQLAFHAKHEHRFEFKDSEYRIIVEWKNKS